MAASSRRKGVTGEREVAAIWQAAGWTLRGLEGKGDWWAISPDSRYTRGTQLMTPLHLEVKRQERIRIVEWLAQAKREAEGMTIPIVCFRQNQGEWYAALPLAALVELAS